MAALYMLFANNSVNTADLKGDLIAQGWNKNYTRADIPKYRAGLLGGQVRHILINC